MNSGKRVSPKYMRKEDMVQDISLSGFRYARMLTRHISPDEAEELKRRYDYVHIYSFSNKDLPGFEKKVQRTPVFDLTEDLDTIFKRFNDTCKKHIRRAERNADLFIKVCDDNAAASYVLYERVKRGEGAHPDIEQEFTNCLLFNAYLGGEMIVTMSFYDNGDIIRAKHIASVRKEAGVDPKIIAHASRRLNWEVIKWGKVNGRKIFDLGGVTDDPTKSGIREFKESFGGTETDIFMYRYTTPEFAALKKTLNMSGKNIN